MRTCSNCQGKGQIIQTPCKKCRGEGRIEKERTIEIKIPAGVETGSRLRVAGEGEAGVTAGRPGDLYVVIHVEEHENFERQGANLYSAVPITFAQAALGADIKVKTLDGEEDLKIPGRHADRDGLSSKDTRNAKPRRPRQRRPIRRRRLSRPKR